MSDVAGNWPDLDRAELRIFDPNGAEPGPPPVPPRPKPAWREERPARDLFGLALSGGGIRSATFNLGLLQKLDSLGILRGFDYLSTVSGGGYLGGFWTAWLSRSKERKGKFPKGENLREAGEIRHLREFSNFLRPRITLLSFETGRIASGLAAALLPSITISLAFVVSVLFAWLGVAWLLLAETPGRWLEGFGSAVALFAVTTLVLVVFELVWRRHPQERRALGASRFWIWAAISAVAAGMVWLVLWQLVPLPFPFLLRPAGLGELWPHMAMALLPAFAWAMAAVPLIALRSLLSRRFARGYWERVHQGALERVLSLVLLCASVWSVIGVLWVVGQILAGEGISGLVAAMGTGAAGGGAFSWARKLLGAQPNKPTGGKRLERLRPWIPKLLAYVTLAAATAGAVTLLVLLFEGLGPAGVFAISAACLAVIALAVWLFDPHENGLHAFYRARLVRAYLGASNLQAVRRATTECEHDDIRLNCLPDRPLHLICCAANDLSADPLGTLHRGADSAVFSKLGLQIGHRWLPWANDSKKPGATPSDGAPESPWLGSILTASGAAFNSHMGGKSMNLGQAATFLLTALNLRLGLWLENPAAHPMGRGASAWTKLQRRFRGILYFRELLGLSRAHSTWVYLSDGGHFENLALYELIRRHCRYILLSDCGADPEVAFDDFGNAVRRIREDFGVEIDIDLSSLRPVSSGYASQPMAAGTIKYSEEDVGILLYIKPTLVGKEPPDIAQYAGRNKDFPHETTLDQFYDEAQWESYRRLGEHIADQALRHVVEALKPGFFLDRPELTRLFLRARYAWPPGGLDEPAVMAELDRAWTELERRLDRDAALRTEFLPVLGEGNGSTTEEALAATLPLVKEALRLMEAFYLRTGINATTFAGSHPGYMGWLNRFGRWASAPPFRAWWRWLAPLHSEPFVRFMQSSFRLPKAGDWSGRVCLIQPGDRGYAWTRWKAIKKTEDRKAATYFGFFANLEGLEQKLLAAVVEVKLDENRSIARWDRDRLFVPPGLWGMGIGEAFLDELINELKKEPYKIEQIRVGIKEGDPPSVAWDALYMGAGFRRSPNGTFVRTF
jgi:GNAT superfamily N-acetyltransferase